MNDWNEDTAKGLDTQAARLMAAEDALEIAYAVLEYRGKDKTCTELRAVASLLRLEKREISEEARSLRRHVDVDQLPISLTTRNVRPG
jgi:hypothetical protein